VHTWQLGSLAFFAYTGLLAALLHGLTRTARLRAFAGSALGVCVILVSAVVSPQGLATVWVLPPAALLIGYWTSGLLFTAPMPRAERFLVDLDGRLRIHQIGARLPRAVVEVLEFAYSGVYPLIPVTLYLALRQGINAEQFWATILLTDYVCFGMLPWVQTRPPRAIGLDAPWRATWRRVNLRLLARTSVQVNTFPSGHAAEALACALLVTGGPPLVTGLMFLIAAAISAGTVFGRYHYAADAIAGWAVALLAWGSLRS
jgi:membrane-associated phospholipid phosphatase